MELAVLVTGAAGFIGFHLARRLLGEGRRVIGVDNLNPYYDPALKRARLAVLEDHPRFRFLELDLADRHAAEQLFATEEFGPVVHLAAQAGVRYSIQAPYAYLESNLAAFLAILEGCRARRSPHLVFASSSSVYGANARLPLSAEEPADHPVSFYAATKRANELMAHAYSDLYALPVTGLRFFTVYGPWGRPDMAMSLFTAAILKGEPIRLFNHGHMRRDFTYIDDVVEALARLVDEPPHPDPAWDGGRPNPSSSRAPWRLYNIGNHDAVELGRLVEVLERAIGRAAIREFAPMQPGDVVETFADTVPLEAAVGFRASTSIEEGVPKFVAWYREHYGV